MLDINDANRTGLNLPKGYDGSNRMGLEHLMGIDNANQKREGENTNP